MSNTLGVDIGGTLIKGLRLGEGGGIEARDTARVPDTPQALLQVTGDMLDQLRRGDTAAVGVGMAGLVRWPMGTFVWGPHLPWLDLPIGGYLTERLQLPVSVDNDANCAVVAEVEQGSARGARHVVLITIGTGIGSGLYLDGQLYRGSSFAGELGHMKLAVGGPPCACGGRGCWETMVSNARLEPWLSLAQAGDEEARRQLWGIGEWLGRGLVLVATVLDPEVLVIGGGGGASAGEYLLPPARAAVAEAWTGSRFREPVPVLAAAAGTWAGALGAALIARQTSG